MEYCFKFSDIMFTDITLFNMLFLIALAVLVILGIIALVKYIRSK